MMYFKIDRGDGGWNYAACDFVPGNEAVEITEEEYNTGVEELLASANTPSDDATEEDLLDALAELGVIS